MQTGILKVYGEEDEYGALLFENSPVSVEAFVARILVESESLSLTIYLEDEDLKEDLPECEPTKVIGEIIVLDSQISEEDWGKIHSELLTFQDDENAKHCNYYWLPHDTDFISGAELQEEIEAILIFDTGLNCSVSLNDLIDRYNEAADGLVSRERIQSALDRLVSKKKAYKDDDGNYRDVNAPFRGLEKEFQEV